MPVQVDPIWEDILAATQEQGDFEVVADGDIIVSGSTLDHLRSGSSLRILGGKLKWASGGQANWPLFTLNEDNVHLSASIEIDDGGYGCLAVGVSGIDVEINVKGTAHAYVQAIFDGVTPLPFVSGMGIRFDGVRNSRALLYANGTMGGLYAFSDKRRSYGLDLETYCNDVALGNNVINASQVKLKTRVHSWIKYGATYGSGQNGDGITIDQSTDLSIDAVISDTSCYGVAIGPISGTAVEPRNRNIRFERLEINGGITAGILANGVDGLIIEDLMMRSVGASTIFKDSRVQIGRLQFGPSADAFWMQGSDVRVAQLIDAPSPWYVGGSGNTARVAGDPVS